MTKLVLELEEKGQPMQIEEKDNLKPKRADCDSSVKVTTIHFLLTMSPIPLCAAKFRSLFGLIEYERKGGKKTLRKIKKRKEKKISRIYSIFLY